MSIESSAFGTTRLTKGDAEKFKRQVTYGRPNKQAHATLKDGQALAKTLASKGVVTFKIKK